MMCAFYIMCLHHIHFSVLSHFPSASAPPKRPPNLRGKKGEKKEKKEAAV